MAKRPEVIRDKDCMRLWSTSQRWKGKTVTLVPTMGFLHKGHLSLIWEAKARADVVVISIYLNPGQFAPSEDLATYPSDLQGDIQKLAAAEVDAAFCPSNLYDHGSNALTGEAGSSGSDGRATVSCLRSGDGGGEGVMKHGLGSRGSRRDCVGRAGLSSLEGLPPLWPSYSMLWSLTSRSLGRKITNSGALFVGLRGSNS